MYLCLPRHRPPPSVTPTHTLTHTHTHTHTYTHTHTGLVGGNFLFFWLTACVCVYLGAKRASAVAAAGEIFQSVNTRNAVFAPIAASVSLFGTYYLLKNQFDIATVYQVYTHRERERERERD